jgi:hypothetical protein
VRLHTDVEVVIEGRVSADGEDGACVQVERYGVLDLTVPPYKISLPAGGGGSGGSVWITSERVIGTGTVSVVGGSVTRGCEAERTVSGGGAGGGGRIAVDYETSSSGLKMQAWGGDSLCLLAAAGTIYDSKRG